MKPRIKIASALTPDGGEMTLYQHDRDFLIQINGEDLMHSRRHASELALARLGCAHLAGSRAPCVLVGGLGMGFTLRQALDTLGPQAQVVVGELMAAVVEWNRMFFGPLSGRPLDDGRVALETGDIVALITRCQSRFDAILLDIDNGPAGITDWRNRRLYGHEGLWACQRALRPAGCLAVWSAVPSRAFEQALMDTGFHVRRFRVPAHEGDKSPSCFVWVASQDEMKLPPGGGAPRVPEKPPSTPYRSGSRGRRPSRRG